MDLEPVFTDPAERPPQIGVVVLEADETVEPDLHRMLPPPIEILVTRVPSGAHVSPETLTAMDGRLTEAAGRLPGGACLGAVGYGCTSASALIGADRVHQQIAAALPAPAPEVSDPFTACLAACAALGVQRIGIVSPYVASVSDQLTAAFTSRGVHVVELASFNVGEEARVVRIAPEATLAAASRIGAGDDVEAVFLSCTNLRTLDVIAPAEAALGKPVLSSNTALAWHLSRLAGVSAAARIPGALGRV